SWGLLAPKPRGVFRYRLLSYTSTWDCSSMLNLRNIYFFKVVVLSINQEDETAFTYGTNHILAIH
ncbi:hypothetical protein, partial [Prevotella jejuni]